MQFEFFLPAKVLPKGFIYPESYINYISGQLQEIEPWHFYYNGLQFAYEGLKKRYPLRCLVPFARRNDNDDVACFEIINNSNIIVVIIHDFASPGWENRGKFLDFNQWLDLARSESKDYKNYMERGHHIDYMELSKAVSHILRHAPWLYELELDKEGWVQCADLLAGLYKVRPEWSVLEEAHLHEMMSKFDKQRFEIKHGKIRALYGHTTPYKLEKKISVPPKVLYHGTSSKQFHSIEHAGLLPLKRHYVHLSIDKKTAYEVGRRKHPEPIILLIDAFEASKEGIKFYFGNDQVWLADAIPFKYIKIAS